MPLLYRLDHVILAAVARDPWIDDFERILALRPEGTGEGRVTDDRAFKNVTFMLGDGYIGIVEPAGERSSLHRFLARFGDGLYGLSVVVESFEAARVALEAQGVDHRTDSQLGFVWAGPKATHGVLYQLAAQQTMRGASPNPSFQGLANYTIVVARLDEAVRDYERLFGLTADDVVGGAPPGTRAAQFSLPGSRLSQTLVLAEPSIATGPAAAQLRTRGEGIYSFGIAVADLGSEVDRLAGLGVEVTRGEGRAQIAPERLRGLRVELWECLPGDDFGHDAGSR